MHTRIMKHDPAPSSCSPHSWEDRPGRKKTERNRDDMLKQVAKTEKSNMHLFVSTEPLLTIC